MKKVDNYCKIFSTSDMKKRTTFGISFPDENLLKKAKERASELGIRSFSDYINQLIKYDLGLPNCIGQYIAKDISTLTPPPPPEREPTLEEVRAAREKFRKGNFPSPFRR